MRKRTAVQTWEVQKPEIVRAPPAELSAEVQARRAQLIAEGEERKQNGIAPATLKAYESDWRHYLAWCESLAFTPMPADDNTLKAYIVASTDGVDEPVRAAATVRRRLTTIGQAHLIAGFRDPTKSAEVRAAWHQTLRTIGAAPKPKRPLLIREASAVAQCLPTTLVGLRDRAVFLFGVHSAMRRSEIVMLQHGDLDIDEDRLVVRIRWSKTNQKGELERIRIDREPDPEACPVVALERWLAAAKITSGPIFRAVRNNVVADHGLCAKSVGLIVKRHVEATGLGDPAAYGAHSMRHGYATSRALEGDDNRTIRKRTRHKSDRMVERYIHDAEFVSTKGKVHGTE